VVQRNRKVVEALGWLTERVNNTEKKELALISLALCSFCMHYRFSEALAREHWPEPTFCSAAPQSQ